ARVVRGSGSAPVIVNGDGRLGTQISAPGHRSRPLRHPADVSQGDQRLVIDFAVDGALDLAGAGGSIDGDGTPQREGAGRDRYRNQESFVGGRVGGSFFAVLSDPQKELGVVVAIDVP